MATTTMAHIRKTMMIKIKSIMEYWQWNEVDDYAEARKWAALKLISASHVLVRDMLFDPDTMNFNEFMRNRFIPEIAIQRRSGYLRLRLRTSKFDHRQNLIFIKKVDLYVVAVYDGLRLYEIGFSTNKARYFYSVWFTRFTDKFRFLSGR
ncbi:hypothetical protein Tco_0720227 [Tanacetum coccineum]